MTVKEVLSLLSFGERFELVDAKTRKRLCCSLNNKKEYIEKYNDYEVTDSPIYASLYTNKKKNYAYPIISILVSVE